MVKQGGVLSNNKGINKQGGGLTAPALTAKDMEDIKTAMSFQAEYLAVSFPKNATDMEMARQLANVAGEAYRHKPALIAKIERSEAIPQLEAILKASDGIMVARGDLAVEVGPAAVPALQKRMIRMARALDKITITATQMMESMVQNPVPTRAEVSDVANAVLDGTDAVMLSAETAAGQYPVETVEQMALIALEAERAEDVELDGNFSNKHLGRIDQSIAMGALFTAYHLGCKAIVALTESGSTALWMSRHNIHVPIFGVTSSTNSERRMALYRNVRPILMAAHSDRDEALADAERLLVERGVLMPGDTYAITCGEPMGYPGGTNMLKVCRVQLTHPRSAFGAPPQGGNTSSPAKPVLRCLLDLAPVCAAGASLKSLLHSPSAEVRHATRLHAPTARPCGRERLRHPCLQRQQPGAGAGGDERGRRGRRAGDPAGQRRGAQVRRRALHQAPDPGRHRDLAADPAGHAPGPRHRARRCARAPSTWASAR